MRIPLYELYVSYRILTASSTEKWHLTGFFRDHNIRQAGHGLRLDLPPEAPSFITRVCGFEFHILGRHVGQARRARSLQVSQALDAPLRVFGFPAMSAV
jgi:hypothetical protein